MAQFDDLAPEVQQKLTDCAWNIYFLLRATPQGRKLIEAKKGEIYGERENREPQGL